MGVFLIVLAGPWLRSGAQAGRLMATLAEVYVNVKCLFDHGVMWDKPSKC